MPSQGKGRKVLSRRQLGGKETARQPVPVAVALAAAGVDSGVGVGVAVFPAKHKECTDQDCENECSDLGLFPILGGAEKSRFQDPAASCQTAAG